MQPDTLYAKSGDVHIAYQVFGEGPLNVVFAPPGFIQRRALWDEPDVGCWLLRLASYARVVIFDKRGTGLSDRVSRLPGLDQRMDDLRAVMDAADMEQAALLGISEGGTMSALFAATYPESLPRAGALQLFRFRHLVPDGRRWSNVSTISSELGQRRQRGKICALPRERPGVKTLVGKERANVESPAGAAA